MSTTITKILSEDEIAGLKRTRERLVELIAMNRPLLAKALKAAKAIGETSTKWIDDFYAMEHTVAAIDKLFPNNNIQPQTKE